MRVGHRAHAYNRYLVAWPPGPPLCFAVDVQVKVQVTPSNTAANVSNTSLPTPLVPNDTSR